MNPITEKHFHLLRRLLDAVAERQRDLTLEIKELPGRIDWRIATHIEDQPLIIGRGGSHIKALQFLGWRLGDSVDTDYHVNLLSPERPARRKESPPRQAKEYDATEALQLLKDWLAVLLQAPPHVDAHVDCFPDLSPKVPITFTFKICPMTHADQETLVVSPEDARDNQTIIGALGTLFRAYGQRDGVTFKLEVPE